MRRIYLACELPNLERCLRLSLAGYLCAILVAGLVLLPYAWADKPPKSAVVLFEGKVASHWQHSAGRECRWKIADGILEVAPRQGGDLVTKERYGDFKLHIEFRVPSMPDKKGQARGNSGIKLHGLYEIQILDSIDNPTYKAGGCGAIYRLREPDKNMAKQPGEWQTYDIEFRAPRLDATGTMVEKPRISLVWNGVKVHDNVELDAPTNSAVKPASLPATGPILLQDHGCPVAFRNIWILVLKPRMNTDEHGLDSWPESK